MSSNLHPQQWNLHPDSVQVASVTSCVSWVLDWTRLCVFHTRRRCSRPQGVGQRPLSQSLRWPRCGLCREWWDRSHWNFGIRSSIAGFCDIWDQVRSWSSHLQQHILPFDALQYSCEQILCVAGTRCRGVKGQAIHLTIELSFTVAILKLHLPKT